MAAVHQSFGHFQSPQTALGTLRNEKCRMSEFVAIETPDADTIQPAIILYVT